MTNLSRKLLLFVRPQAAALALLAFFLTTPLSAANILVFEDFSIGTSVIPGALSLSGRCGLCTFTSTPDEFNTALTGSIWDLVIYAEQDSDSFSSSTTQLAAYLSSGGRIIGQTWRTDGLATLLQATWVSENGDTITTTADSVFNGVGSSILLSNPGWGVFSQGWDPAAGAFGLGTIVGGGSALIIGNGGRTVLNASLTDAYAAVTQGERFLANEVVILLDGGWFDPSIPEPGTAVLFALGLAGLVAAGRRRT